MRAYQIYFHNENGFVVGRHDLFARDDAHVLRIASIAHLACADMAVSYAVRQGARTIVGCAGAGAGRIPLSAQELAEWREQAAVELEEQMQQGGWAVAKSRRLQAQLDYIRAWPSLAQDKAHPGDLPG